MNPSVYKRPNKPAFMTVTRRKGAPERALPALPEAVEVDKFTECHVTPLDIASRMVGYLNAPADANIAEPQAGTGNIIQALLNAGYSLNQITAIERHYKLSDTLRSRFQGLKLINGCFLDYSTQNKDNVSFSHIIKNPPFKKVRQHMDSALNMLSPGSDGRCALVALVPVTYQHEDAETLETLPRDTFITVGVSTKIIRIEYL